MDREINVDGNILKAYMDVMNNDAREKGLPENAYVPIDMTPPGEMPIDVETSLTEEQMRALRTAVRFLVDAGCMSKLSLEHGVGEPDKLYEELGIGTSVKVDMRDGSVAEAYVRFNPEIAKRAGLTEQYAYADRDIKMLLYDGAPVVVSVE